MPGFSDIYGQEQLKKLLQNAVLRKNAAHAYIFSGEKGSGKGMLADVFAQALQCTGEYGKPCGKCHDCLQAQSKSHPDIIYVTHEKPNTISVGDIRTQVNSDMGVKPYSGEYKIYIIDEAEKMNVQAQNALLKTLEEPPAYGMILLLCSNIGMMLPTILSRCVVLNMKPASNAEIRSFLRSNGVSDEYRMNICIAFSRGNMGRALNLVQDESFDRVRELAVDLAKYARRMDAAAIADVMKKLEEEKLDAEEFLDVLRVWFRDILLAKSGGDTNHLIFKEDIQYIKQDAEKWEYSELEEIGRIIDRTSSRLAANVNADLSLQLLGLALRGSDGE